MLPDVVYQHPQLINIAQIAIHTQALGPGTRSVVWFQGCLLHCAGCIAPGWIPLRKKHLASPEDIAFILLSDPAVTGVTISGGEPFLQPDRLFDLVVELKKIRDIDVICYSGYTFEQLTSSESPSIRGILHMIDILIDGPYQMSFNDGKGLRGSNNQRIIELSHRLRKEELENYPRKLDIRISNGESLIIGVPPKQIENTLTSLFQVKV